MAEVMAWGGMFIHQHFLEMTFSLKPFYQFQPNSVESIHMEKRFRFVQI